MKRIIITTVFILFGTCSIGYSQNFANYTPKENIDKNKNEDSAEQEARLNAYKELKEILKEEKDNSKMMRRQIRPHQRKVNKYLKNEKKDQRTFRKKNAKLIYKEAKRLFKMKKYAEAKIQFTSAENLFPGYRSARKYILESERGLVRQRFAYDVDLSSDNKKIYKTYYPDGNVELQLSFLDGKLINYKYFDKKGQLQQIK